LFDYLRKNPYNNRKWGDKLSAAKKIKILLVEREMTLTELSKRLNKSLSTMSDKMTRDNFSEKDLKKIAEVLNYEYDIVFTDKDTGKTI
jgi:transcriptional regulator with XRE-family HTH domain